MNTPSRTSLFRTTAVSLALALAGVGCGVAEGATEALTSNDPATVEAATVVDQSALWDSSVVHDIEISFDQTAYDEMIATFEASSEKDWISATVTIDGTTFEDVGLRLKGNSSLFSLTTETAQNPEQLPWLIRLDKYVDEQSYDGWVDLVVRSNSTETSMNEAVALDLLDAAGLASEAPISIRLTVNGGETELRLVVQNPDDSWLEDNFDAAASVLYKAESDGDYTYRGDDWDAYDDIFDLEAGIDDMDPLIGFLEFINTADDATFLAELPQQLDVDAFATYLAFQNLIGNADDIDGRGNNSYLHYDYETEQFTVVNWDLNLAFNTANVGGGGGGGARPDGAGARPERTGAQGQANGGPGDAGNVLSDRFLSVPEFSELYDDAVVSLTGSLFESGLAQDVVDTWASTLTENASDLVDPAVIAANADALVQAFPTT